MTTPDDSTSAQGGSPEDHQASPEDRAGAADPTQEIWLVRHGETEWSRDGRHTGSSDVPLTPKGEKAARLLHDALAAERFDEVLVSPRQRARRTAELAGFTDATVTDDVAEWDYGEYEGLTRPQIQEQRPGWTIWADGAPGGESPAEITKRVDRLVGKLRSSGCDRVLVFAHGHVLRCLGARWVEEPVVVGEHLFLDTATISLLGYDRGIPVLLRWNCPVG